MNPRIENGWLVVDCDAPDQTPVWIGAGKSPERVLVPAFRAYSAGVRVAAARVPVGPGRTMVYIKVGDVMSVAGVLVI